MRARLPLSFSLFLTDRDKKLGNANKICRNKYKIPWNVFSVYRFAACVRTDKGNALIGYSAGMLTSLNDLIVTSIFFLVKPFIVFSLWGFISKRTGTFCSSLTVCCLSVCVTLQENLLSQLHWIRVNVFRYSSGYRTIFRVAVNVDSSWKVMAHGDAREGKWWLETGECSE